MSRVNEMAHAHTNFLKILFSSVMALFSDQTQRPLKQEWCLLLHVIVHYIWPKVEGLTEEHALKGQSAGSTGGSLLSKLDYNATYKYPVI